MDIPTEIIDQYPALGKWRFLTAYRGSIAHGMYIHNSDPLSIDDRDVIGICIPDIEHYFALKTYGRQGTREFTVGVWDIVTHEFRKFMRQLQKGNPNVLGLLWLDEKDYLFRSPEAQWLISERDKFMGMHLRKPFLGYAESQLERMEKPSKEGYMGSKRKALFDRFGYDVKNASHTIRLLRMAIEVFTEGIVRVKRTEDVQELLAIKRGEWTLDRVKEEAERLFAAAKEAHDKCDLPDGPSHKYVNNLCVEILRSTFAGRRSNEEARRLGPIIY